MDWFEEQKAIAARQIAAMTSDHAHKTYEHSLEETVRSLMSKLDERDLEIARLRELITNLTKED
jgi:hypothetical protein